MPFNPSVAQFKRDMFDLSKRVSMDFHDLILAQADEVISNMRSVVPVKTGTLKNSIRKKDISQNYGNREVISVLVIAGGYATTKRTAEGDSYDYAVATEFGTVNETPEPFFYHTFRAYETVGVQEAKQTLDDIISENNKTRALRTNNYSSSFGFTKSISYRGAVVRKGRL